MQTLAAVLKAAKAPHATVGVTRTAAGALAVRVADLPAGPPSRPMCCWP